MSDYDGVGPSFFSIIIIIAFVVLLGVALWFDVSGQTLRYAYKKTDALTPISDKLLSYNGTLSLLTYQYSYWGSVVSTKLTFLDGFNCTLGGQVVGALGQNYTVILKEITFKDNHTETTALYLNES